MDGQMTIFDFPECIPKEIKQSDYPCDDCKWDKNGCCGYNTKEDYCVLGNKKELKSDDFETMTIERAVELLQNRTPLKFKLDERFAHNHYSSKYKGVEIQIGFSHFAPEVYGGRRFLDCQADYGKAGKGSPTLDIDDAVRFINNSIKEYLGG